MTVTQSLTYPNTWFKGLIITHKKSAKDTKCRVNKRNKDGIYKIWMGYLSLGNEIDLNNRMLSKASIDNYEKLCGEKF